LTRKNTLLSNVHQIPRAQARTNSGRLAISGEAGIADTAVRPPRRRVLFAPLFGRAKSGKSSAAYKRRLLPQNAETKNRREAQ
jgi:hypothetical protein